MTYLCGEAKAWTRAIALYLLLLFAAKAENDLGKLSMPKSIVIQMNKRPIGRRRPADSLSKSNFIASLPLQDPKLTAKLPMTNQNNLAYYANIGVGLDANGNGPLQRFDVLLDTGSPDLWIPSIECVYGCENKTQFNHFQSELFVSNQDTFTINYEDGSMVIGFTGNDTFTIGNMTVPNQPFGLATGCELLGTSQYDGVLGLGLLSQAEPGLMPLVYNMALQGVLARPVFSMWLAPPERTAMEGLLVLGDSDSRLYIGELESVPVIASSKYWQVNLSSIALNYTTEDALITVPSVSTSAIVDSGTSFIRIPVADFEQLLALLKGNQTDFYGNDSTGYTLSCRARATLPDLLLQLGNVTLSLSQEYYVSTPAILNIDHNDPSYEDVCFLMITPSTDSNDRWVLGDTFMRKYYTVFDAANGHIQFAPAAPQIQQEI